MNITGGLYRALTIFVRFVVKWDGFFSAVPMAGVKGSTVFAAMRKRGRLSSADPAAGACIYLSSGFAAAGAIAAAGFFFGGIFFIASLRAAGS